MHWSCLISSLIAGINQPNVEVTIAKIVVGLVASWLTSWTPYSIVALLGVTGHSHIITPFNAMLPALFAKSAACIDPFIYSLNHPKIRHEIVYRLYNSFFNVGRRTGSLVSESNNRGASWRAATKGQILGRSNRRTERNSAHCRNGQRSANKVPVIVLNTCDGQDEQMEFSFSSNQDRTVDLDGIEAREVLVNMMIRPNHAAGKRGRESYMLEAINHDFDCAEVLESEVITVAHDVLKSARIPATRV